jgi:hypothetical protein
MDIKAKRCHENYEQDVRCNINYTEGGHKLIERTEGNTFKNEKKLGRTIRLKHTTKINLTHDCQNEKMKVEVAMNEMDEM